MDTVHVMALTRAAISLISTISDIDERQAQLPAL